jgi:hypothetical protein
MLVSKSLKLCKLSSFSNLKYCDEKREDHRALMMGHTHAGLGTKPKVRFGGLSEKDDLQLELENYKDYSYIDKYSYDSVEDDDVSSSPCSPCSPCATGPQQNPAPPTRSILKKTSNNRPSYSNNPLLNLKRLSLNWLRHDFTKTAVKQVEKCQLHNGVYVDHFALVLDKLVDTFLIELPYHHITQINSIISAGSFAEVYFKLQNYANINGMRSTNHCLPSPASTSLGLRDMKVPTFFLHRLV